jgi:hypothetical protein
LAPAWDFPDTPRSRSTKYRERSYFLPQTADSIEEHANAFTLALALGG